MHELGTVFYVIREVEQVVEENHLTKVASVTLEIGEVSGIIPYYLTDCWQWAIQKSQYLKEAELKIETVLTTEGTVTTDADQADLLEKIQQMQKDLQDGEILDVGGYQVTISTSKDEIIEILHKVGETTDFTRLTREELKALLEKEKAEADAAGIKDWLSAGLYRGHIVYMPPLPLPELDRDVMSEFLAEIIAVQKTDPQRAANYAVKGFPKDSVGGK